MERTERVLAVVLVVLVVGETVLWLRTPRGQAVLARLKGCSGCARRRALLRSMVDRVHAEAERIVSGSEP